MNPYARLVRLLPRPQTLVAVVLERHEDNTSTVALLGTDTRRWMIDKVSPEPLVTYARLRVRGATAAIYSQVLVRDGVIVQELASLQYLGFATVGRVRARLEPLRFYGPYPDLTVSAAASFGERHVKTFFATGFGPMVPAAVFTADAVVLTQFVWDNELWIGLRNLHPVYKFFRGALPGQRIRVTDALGAVAESNPFTVTVVD